MLINNQYHLDRSDSLKRARCKSGTTFASTRLLLAMVPRWYRMESAAVYVGKYASKEQEATCRGCRNQAKDETLACKSAVTGKRQGHEDVAYNITVTSQLC